MDLALTAGLAWAMPVEPDELGISLEAFKRTFPELQTLRMCHRFGKGPNVLLTKLPAEIVLMIEELLLSEGRRRYNYGFSDAYMWKKQFECYQSTCSPTSHCEEMSPLWDAAYDDLILCKSCKENNVYEGECTKRCTAKTSKKCVECIDVLDPEHCENSCLAEYEEALEQLAWESERVWEWHRERQDAWKGRMTQGKNGFFNKYDKEILQQHFGLEVFLAETRLDRTHPERWPSHPNNRWHGADDRRTTLCYLTLPKRLGPHSHFEATELENDYLGEVSIQAAQVTPVEFPSLEDAQPKFWRFDRALQTLDLKPCLHESQHTKISVTADLELSKSGEGSKKAAEVWPQMMLLTRAR